MTDFKLAPLPYDKKALQGFLSDNTLTFHHDKHLNAYVETANKLKKGTAFEDKSVEEIIKNAEPGPLFNNTAQIFNHEFYFKCLSPSPAKQQVPLVLQDKINAAFGSLEAFLEKFRSSAVGNFGSGWTWLCLNEDKLEIVNTSNAANPLTLGKKPLLTVDVWEHAYYLDFQNRRADYLKEFCEHINWEFVSSNL
jgi:Fe-Mn family superoxide dismutase